MAFVCTALVFASSSRVRTSSLFFAKQQRTLSSRVNKQVKMATASMQNVVLIDMDNTLVNWDKEFARRWAEQRPDDDADMIKDRQHFELEQNFNKELMPVAVEIMSQAGFYAALEPQPGAIGAVREMSDAGLHVLFCTAPMPFQYETCVAEKYAWVRQWLGEEFLPRMIITRDKTVVKGRVLIDDKPAVKGRCDEPEWEHIVFEQPYNVGVKGRPRMKNWAEWRAVLGNYFELKA